MEKEIDEAPILFIGVEENNGNEEMPYKLKLNDKIEEVFKKMKDNFVRHS